jgi:hypothetical protein
LRAVTPLPEMTRDRGAPGPSRQSAWTPAASTAAPLNRQNGPMLHQTAIELGGEIADTAERCFVSHLRAAAVIFDGVPEPLDVLPIDFAAQQLGHRFGIVGWIPDGEVLRTACEARCHP